MALHRVNCSWVMCGELVVEAENKRAAEDSAYEVASLPWERHENVKPEHVVTNEEYLDDSFRVLSVENA